MTATRGFSKTKERFINIPMLTAAIILSMALSITLFMLPPQSSSLLALPNSLYQQANTPLLNVPTGASTNTGTNAGSGVVSRPPSISQLTLPTDTPTVPLFTSSSTSTSTSTPAPNCGATWRIVASPDGSTSGNNLSSVTAISPYDAWAVGYSIDNNIGDRTMIQHWDGVNWNLVPSPNASTNNNILYGVFALSSTDVWAVGSYADSSFIGRTLTMHWNGTSWSILPSPNGSGDSELRSVTALARNDVWAVGESGGLTLAVHWNGVAWSIVTSPTPANSNGSLLLGLSATGPDDVWAAGTYLNTASSMHANLVMHWDGTTWGLVSVPGSFDDRLNAVKAIAPDNIWVVGTEYGPPGQYHATALKWNGSNWIGIQLANAGLGGTGLNGVAVDGDDIWLVGSAPQSSTTQTMVQHCVGTQCAIVPSAITAANSGFSAVAAIWPNDLWAVGTVGNHTLTQRYNDPCVTPGTYVPPTSTSTNTSILSPTSTRTRTFTPTPTPCIASWEFGPNLPVASARGLGIWMPQTSRFYLLGGRSSDSPGAGLRNPYVFNPATNSWAFEDVQFSDDNVSSMDGGLLTGPDGPRIYLVGGSSTTNSAISDVRVYDPFSNTITTLTTDPWPALSDTMPGGQAVFNNKLYIFGGSTFGAGLSDEIWEFDPSGTAGARWTLKNTHLPQPMAFVPATTIGNFIYTAGGVVRVGNSFQDSPQTYRYDPVTDAIDDASVPDLPGSGTSQTRAITWNGQIWVLGGGFGPGNAQTTIFTWQPGDNSWATGPALLTGRRAFAVDAQPGVGIYVAGGYAPNSLSASMEIYNPDNGSCLTVTPTTPTSTWTLTRTRTPTATYTSTSTPTNTPTFTYTSTITNTPAPTHTATNTNTPTTTITSSSTPTWTGTAIPCAPGSWNFVDSPNYNPGQNLLTAVSALSATDVWAVGYYCSSCSTMPLEPLIEHWNGQEWSISASPSIGTQSNRLTGVDAISTDDVWAVGYYFASNIRRSLTMHWDGTQWTIVPSPSVDTIDTLLQGVTAIATNDVWAVGYSFVTANTNLHAVFEHWNGTQWNLVSSPDVPGAVSVLVSGITSISTDDIWAVGWYKDGSSITRTLTYHWDGTQWNLIPSANASGNNNGLSTVSAIASDDIWAVGSYQLSQSGTIKMLALHWDGSQWSSYPVPDLDPSSNAVNRLQGVKALSANNVWAVGQYSGVSTQAAVAHWDGTQWSTADNSSPFMTYSNLLAADASGVDNLWAVGQYTPSGTFNNYLPMIERYNVTCPATPTATPTGLPTSTYTSTPVRTPTSSPTITNTPTVTPPGGDAYLVLVPGVAGNCAAPQNGSTTNLGCRFVLDLMLNTGSRNDANSQQSYLTFTYGLLQNSRVSSIGSSCVPTSTLTGDFNTIDTQFQNEVCNGPGACTFRGFPTAAGSIGFVSSGINNCADGCGGYFRIAQMGLCTTAPGQARLHWQFSPPEPVTRDTEIIATNGDTIHDSALFADYVINITLPTATNTSTATYAPTYTPTFTPTNTPTPSLTPMLLGHVAWQGRPTLPSTLQQLPVTLTLKLGNTEINYPPTMTDATGFFTMPIGSLTAGNYTWRVKGPKYLANAGLVNLSGTPITNVEMGLMKAGDANNDNTVDTSDFNILRTSFGVTVGQTGYDGRADFTGDNVVNMADFDLLRRNFRQSGAPPISPWP